MESSNHSRPLTRLTPTGLRQRELCDYLGLDYRAVATTAKQQGLSTHAYLQQETGWVLIKALYYPLPTAAKPAMALPSAQGVTPPSRRRRGLKWLGLCGLAMAVVAVIGTVQQVGIEKIRVNVKALGFWAPFALLMLRSVSIIVPAIPSTAYSILAGGLLGFWPGFALIAIADFVACSGNFYLSKRYGRQVVKQFVGERWMNRVDSLSQKHLENNPFLVTGFLMTGLFDFVCYAVGLTQMQWRTFLPALILGITISTPPVVALGSGVFTKGKWMLGLALLGVFALAVLTGWLNRKFNRN